MISGYFEKFLSSSIDNSANTYTQSGLISTTVNVSVLVVLIFSQNFSTNGAYVVLNFCKFFDIMVLILQKILTLMDSLFFEKILIVPVVIWAISFTKNLVVLNLSTFATWALKVQKFCGPYFLKV